MFSRILIANRGEIALRIVRAAKALGVETVCVYSTADKDGPWLRLADETVCIGEGPSADSYLRIDRIISAAEITQDPLFIAAIKIAFPKCFFRHLCGDKSFEMKSNGCFVLRKYNLNIIFQCHKIK